MFPEEEMETFIHFFNDGKFVAEAEEAKLSLARKFIDELCAKDNSLALYTKGYASYGGNRLYPCNWNISRDCMIRLFEKEDNPNYANTLGYIYYYGRCNQGVPEYDKASFTLDEDAKIWFRDKAEKVRFNFSGWNDVESRFEFFYDEKLVAWVRSANYRFVRAAKGKRRKG